MKESLVYFGKISLKISGSSDTTRRLRKRWIIFFTFGVASALSGRTFCHFTKTFCYNYWNYKNTSKILKVSFVSLTWYVLSVLKSIQKPRWRRLQTKRPKFWLPKTNSRYNSLQNLILLFYYLFYLYITSN